MSFRYFEILIECYGGELKIKVPCFCHICIGCIGADLRVCSPTLISWVTLHE